MQIIKRDGTYQEYSSDKISNAIKKAFKSVENTIPENELKDIIFSIENEIDFRLDRNEPITVEWIQDRVEIELMKREHFKEVRSYILYREGHTKTREAINGIVEIAGDRNIIPTLRKIQSDFTDNVYDLNILLQKYKLLAIEGMNKDLAFDVLVRSAVELISKEAPKYEYIASRLLNYKLNEEIDNKMSNLGLNSFYDKLVYLSIENIYGPYLVDNFSASEIEELGEYIKDERNELFTYSGLDLLQRHYLLHSNDYGLIEKPQEMFMAIAMHLAMNEDNKVLWAKCIYDAISSMKLSLASSILSNARKPIHEMASSYVDVVPDDNFGIYKTLENYLEISKSGGALGLYFGKVKSGRILNWAKLINEAANVTGYVGDKKSACTVYLDVWHKDIVEFIEYKNDDKDHKLLKGICYPNLFWKMAKENINDSWFLMCPKEISEIKGYHLEDFYGEEWDRKYIECVNDDRISKTEISIKEIVRMILKSVIDNGTPFTFNRDHVNNANPNSHMGIIYCSNLCTEIAQNISSTNHISQKIIDEDDDRVIVEKYEAGNYVSSSLASLNLGRINTNDNKELKNIIDIGVRCLDNCIDLNDYPNPYADISSKNYRSIGLGVIGYQHLLVKNGIQFETEKHLAFANDLFERINFFAINASASIAKEKGAYKFFKGSAYDTGEYFDIRHYTDSKWNKLKAKVQAYGLRNGYLLAVSPTSITSIIAGTTRGIEPIYSKYFNEERKGNSITRVAPDLNTKTFWLYKNAHNINQEWAIKANGVRSRHIDQSQSMSLYITNEYTYRQLLNLYIHAYEYGVKTIHYVRNKMVDEIENEKNQI